MIKILIKTFTIDSTNENQRIDIIIPKAINTITRSQVQEFIKQGLIQVNGKKIKKNYQTVKNDKIEVTIPDPRPLEATAENIHIDIVYEDDDLIVVNKPKGMVVHPAPGHPNGTLVNALLYASDRLSGINGVIRPGIVHRIDKDTSGLLIVAKNDFSHKALAKQIKEHSFSREYEAVVYGKMKNEEDVINLPIGRNHKDRKKMAVTYTNSREAITKYKVIKQYSKFTHLRLTLTTGRTHQIRVHMSYIGHPVAGDEVYGPRNAIKSLHGQCLHAKYIGFTHPRTQKFIQFESELPKYFKQFLKTLS